LDSLKVDSRIDTGSLYCRKTFPFHIGDHILAGSTDEMTFFYDQIMKHFQRLMVFETFVQDCEDEKYQRAIFPTDTELHEIYKWHAYSIPAETSFTLDYLWGKGHTVTVYDHIDLMNKYFKVVPFQWFNAFYAHSNTLKISVTHENIAALPEQISNSAKLICTACPKEILCQERKHHALVYALVVGIAEDNSDFFPLDNASFTYNSLVAPWRVLPDFSWRIEL
jgi:hypothetical protein